VITHQYIDRRTRQVRDEQLPGDRIIGALYSPFLENASWLTRIASSRRLSAGLARVAFDSSLGRHAAGAFRFLKNSGIDFSECLDSGAELNTARTIFERQIRYWDCRPMPAAESIVVCAADARVTVASLRETSIVFLKEKVFDFAELLNRTGRSWSEFFARGDFALFRLTPDKYHYVHAPVSGLVLDVYRLGQAHHSCNPTAVVSGISPHSKNCRVVTILDTDVDGGSRVGLVAIVEVVALMVGQIVQCYSREKYADPEEVKPGLFLRRGQPKSLFRPGSSSVICFFQPNRVNFWDDLLSNRFRADVSSRMSLGLGESIVETDVAVRSPLALRQSNDAANQRSDLWRR